jgi:hypothetical protein
MDIFQEATRRKIQFQTNIGNLFTQDLWDLDLKTSPRNQRTSLDALAVELNEELESAPRKSFVDDNATDNSETRLKFDIVMAIIAYKKTERDEAANRANNAATRNKLNELIARKQDAALEDKDIDELRALRDNLA